jgi:aminotransferase
LKYDPETQILVTVGGSEAIDLSLRVLIEPGDEVIIPTPSFVCYSPLTTIAGGVPVFVETKAENQFKLTAEELKGAITPKTKAVILPYPCNPTGGIMEKEDLVGIARVLEGTDIIIISDEIYAELTYGQRHFSPANLEELYPRTIVINGFSKAYAMTGWRLGYVMGTEPLIAQMTKLHQFAIMCSPTTSQYAAIEAMRSGDKDIEQMRSEYDIRRRYLVDGVRTMGLECFEPKGAFYIFPCIKSTGMSSDEFCERFLIEEKVAAISGGAFGPGGEGFVRMCYASSMDNLTEALARLKRFIGRL